MAGYELVHVAVAAPNIPEPDIIKKVATIVNKDPYQTRLSLSGGIPKLIAHYHSIQEAESTAQNLRDLGLAAFICQDSELRKPSKVFTALTTEFLEGEAVFRDKGGQAKKIAYSDVFVILKGIMQTTTKEETIETKRKINLAATLLTFIPIYSKVKERVSATVQEEPLVRLYNRESAEPIVHMLQHSMSYSFLDNEMAPSSLANFNTVVAKLRELCSQASFDDSLIKPPKSNMSYTRTPDDLELNCKLLYLYHKAKSGLSYQG